MKMKKKLEECTPLTSMICLLFEVMPFMASILTLFLCTLGSGAFIHSNIWVSFIFLLGSSLQIPILMYLYVTNDFGIKRYLKKKEMIK